jgi:hypothetical protein
LINNNPIVERNGSDCKHLVQCLDYGPGIALQLSKKYSHLNGEAIMLERFPEHWHEVREAISRVDASICLTKESYEKTKNGKVVYSPPAINAEFRHHLLWNKGCYPFYVTDDPVMHRRIEALAMDEQKRLLQEAGLPLIRSYHEVDFVKTMVALEVQLGKYFAVAADLFFKFLYYYRRGDFDVLIEIMPTKNLASKMSSGVPCYEKEVSNLLRVASDIHFPVVMIGIEPGAVL